MATLVDELHATSKILEVEVAKLRVDSSYQRDVSERLVDEIAADFDQVSAELITVSDRGPRSKDENKVEGGLFIINGQHRAKAAQKSGRELIWARVIDLRKDPEPVVMEARFRLRTNKRLGDRPLERFKAQIAAKDEESVAIAKLVELFGSEINIVPNPDAGINCISTLETIYRLDDGGMLRDTFEVIRDTYGYVGGKYAKADLLKSISWFIDKHAGESDRTRLVGKLQTLGIASLESKARTTQLSMSGALWTNYYRAMVEVYNTDLREKSRLAWKLRGKRALDPGRSSG